MLAQLLDGTTSWMVACAAREMDLRILLCSTFDGTQRKVAGSCQKSPDCILTWFSHITIIFPAKLIDAIRLACQIWSSGGLLVTEQQCSTQQQWKQSVRTLANLQGIAIGRKDVQYLLCVPGDVLQWRPGLQRGRRSKTLALNGRIIMSSS